MSLKPSTQKQEVSMIKKLLLCVVLMVALFAPQWVVAQGQYPILWQDHFDDDETIPQNNVGWWFYGPNNGLTGAVVEQMDGMLHLKMGNFGGLLGAVVAGTNGCPKVVLNEKDDPLPEIVPLIKKNNYSSPNQELTFKINFKKNTGSFFTVSTRMVIDSDSLDSNIQESPGYVLFISPLQGQVSIAKYEGELALLNPLGYQYLAAPAAFSFEIDVFYWVKLFLKKGDMKAKVWEGEFTDEPEDWLVEGVDPQPRVDGQFTYFSLLNPTPGASDEVLIDDVVLRETNFSLLWQDMFDDEEKIPQTNVGWFYYGPNNGLVGAVVEQMDGMLHLTMGNFGGLLGAVVAGTNGCPKVVLNEKDEPSEETYLLIKKDNYSSPNQELTFKINFKKNAGSFFTVSTRMVIDSDSADANIQESPAYVLFISPLQGQVGIGKYEGELALLNPLGYTFFAPMGSFSFEIDVFYWVKLYLIRGDMKVKIWEGDLADEPEDWLVEGVDPEPRIDGNFTYFSLLNPTPGASDQVLIDDVMLRGVSDIASRIEKSPIRSGEIPQSFALHHNYPNPFNPTTTIGFDLLKAGSVELRLFNSLGQEVKTVTRAQLPAGSYQMTVSLADQPSGIYIYQLKTENAVVSKKMLYLK